MKAIALLAWRTEFLHQYVAPDFLPDQQYSIDMFPMGVRDLILRPFDFC